MDSLITGLTILGVYEWGVNVSTKSDNTTVKLQTMCLYITNPIQFG